MYAFLVASFRMTLHRQYGKSLGLRTCNLNAGDLDGLAGGRYIPMCAVLQLGLGPDTRVDVPVHVLCI